ncbi:Beta-cyclopiazonate dehydrogenase [Tolypocladium ophioglossoides CBS 100239]|uniref:Beta-cyclopiazonate dehydrogenase n=1 Tax=Tolypocladium ophioglossoides (strain CBS 100239) TaxID=1163406 RepID=A0A0L0NI28_TOLOC|nr:Beta-cyclopiazonate dehydrogenase [Tolypocladium ophioglossoides CBS 100239]
MRPITTIASIVFFGGSSAASSSMFDQASYAAEHVITRDVAVLGGGATGIYAGVYLGDLNQSVVLIEKNDHLGGHTNTYIDPATGTPVDYGVQFYHNDSVTRAFHERLGVPLVGPSASNVSNLYVDVSKSAVVDNYTVSPIGPDYIDEIHKYPYLDDGFLLPDKLPEDLLLTWPEYIRKHNVTKSAHATFQAPGPAGNPLKRLSLYLFNFVNSLVVSELSGHIVHNANGDNSEIFRKAQADIGATNVLLSSTIVAGRRSHQGIALVLSTPKGRRLIIAKQLVVAAPPRTDNLAPLGLDQRETHILSQVGGYPFYAGLASNTGLPAEFSYNNVAADSEFQVQEPPCMVFISPAPAAPGLFYYTYSSLEPLTQAEVEAATADSIKKLQVALQANGSDTGAAPTFVAFADHSPFHLEQSAESIRNGFYKDMYGLQGYRNTWYIGALFVLSSSQLWNNTAALLPDIVAAAKVTR